MQINWQLAPGWGTRKLGDIAPEDSRQIKPSDFPERDFNYWSLDAIGKGQFTEPRPNIVKGAEILSVCNEFQPHHVLYSKLRPLLNKVITPSVSGIGSTEWVVLKPNPALVDRYFLAYVLRTTTFVNFAARSSTGARQPRVPKDVLWNADIPLPYPDNPELSLATQRRIVARIEALLAEVREMRELNEGISADTEYLIEAVVRDVFKELNVSFPAVLLGNENVCQIIPGQHIMARDYQDTPPGTPYITGPSDFGEKYPIITKWTSNPKAMCQPGDVLFTVKGSGVGKTNCAPLDMPCAISRQIMALRPNQTELSPDYLFYNLLGRFREFQSLRRGAAIPGIRKDHVQAIRIPLPPTKTQIRVVARIEAVLREIQEIKAINVSYQELISQMEQAILAQAFRGEL